MTQEEAEHSLRVWVELDLYKRVRAIKEGNFPDEEKMIKETIQSFEKALPRWTEEIPDCYSIIIDTLKRTEEATEKINKTKQNENKQDQKQNEK